MATEKAEETGAEAEGTSATPPAHESPQEPHLASPTSASSDGTAKPLGESTWTASDTRGPLARAEDAAMPPAGETEPVESVAPVASSGLGSAGEPSGVDTSPRKSSLLPVAAALVIGAVIGAGSAAIVYAMSGSHAGDDPAVADLKTRVATLESRPAPAPTAPDTKLEGAVSDLQKRVAALDSRPAPAAGKAPDLQPLQDKIATLQSDIDGLKKADSTTSDLAGKVGDLERDLAALKGALAKNEAATASLGDAQAALSGKVTTPGLAVAADALVAAIDRGEPYGSELDAAAALGADPASLAILRQNATTGVPSAQTLAARFEPLAPTITAIAHRAPADASFVDKLKSGMFNVVSIRSVDDTSGTDLPSRVAHIRQDLAHDDLADALATWQALPAEAKDKSQAWGAQLKTSAETMAAARTLQHNAISALAAKKS
jgi:hypothetical protein